MTIHTLIDFAGIIFFGLLTYMIIGVMVAEYNRRTTTHVSLDPECDYNTIWFFWLFIGFALLMELTIDPILKRIKK